MLCNSCQSLCNPCQVRGNWWISPVPGSQFKFSASEQPLTDHCSLFTAHCSSPGWLSRMRETVPLSPPGLSGRRRIDIRGEGRGEGPASGMSGVGARSGSRFTVHRSPFTPLPLPITGRAGGRRNFAGEYGRCGVDVDPGSGPSPRPSPRMEITAQNPALLAGRGGTRSLAETAPFSVYSSRFSVLSSRFTDHRSPITDHRSLFTVYCALFLARRLSRMRETVPLSPPGLSGRWRIDIRGEGRGEGPASGMSGVGARSGSRFTVHRSPFTPLASSLQPPASSLQPPASSP
jgi:hypothetical protein